LHSETNHHHLQIIHLTSQSLPPILELALSPSSPLSKTTDQNVTKKRSTVEPTALDTGWSAEIIIRTAMQARWKEVNELFWVREQMWHWVLRFAGFLQRGVLFYSFKRRKCSFLYDVKLLVKEEMTSFSFCSKSLLSAPSLSMVARRSDSLVFRCARKSASQVRILLTGTLSRKPLTPA